MTWDLTFQAVIAVVTVGSAVYATHVARKGSKREADQADRKQSFAELTASLDAARADLAYYTAETAKARDDARTATAEKVAVERAWDAHLRADHATNEGM